MAALVKMMLAPAVRYAILRVGLPNTSLSRPLVFVLVFIAAMVLEQSRQARSFLHLAKRIDVDDDVGDHLVSARG